MRARGALLLVLVGGSALVPAPRGAGADVPGATISVTPATVAVGDRLEVDLSGWPVGIVTAQVCGNSAQRGSTDCDQIGGGSIRVPPNGVESVTIDALAPPVGCTCVVRAATTNDDVVRTAPITVLGVPTGVNLPAANGLADASSLHITAELRNADVGWPRSWYAAFGGPAYKELVLQIRNSSDGTLEGLRVAGRVGHRGTDEGEPIDAAIPPIPAQTTHEEVVPVLLSSPVYGDYTVRGAIYGLDVPVRFVEHTTSEPWALEIGLPVALLLVAQVLRARDRRRRAKQREADAEAAEFSSFLQSSPAVGAEDGLSWVSPPYSESVSGGVAPPADIDPVPTGLGSQHL